MYRPDKPLRSYCHGIMTAAHGQTLYLLEKDILCKSGTATLGFSNYSDEMLSGHKHYNTGVFGTIEAAKNAVTGAYKFEDGSTSAVFLRPLSHADNNYQVILIPANAEQIMFIILADKYYTGGEDRDFNGHRLSGSLWGCYCLFHTDRQDQFFSHRLRRPLAVWS